MADRSLTEEEENNFSYLADHSNMVEDSYCCPHCYASNDYSDYSCDFILFDEYRVVECIEKDCGKEFIVWAEQITQYCSAKL